MWCWWQRLGNGLLAPHKLIPGIATAWLIILLDLPPGTEDTQVSADRYSEQDCSQDPIDGHRPVPTDRAMDERREACACKNVIPP